MKIVLLLFVFSFTAFCSCATFDVEKNLGESGVGRIQGPENSSVPIWVEPNVVVKDRPIYVPEKEPVPRAPATGVQAVLDSNAVGIAKPSEYSHAAMVYDYDPDWVYEIYAMPLRACDIILEPEERAVEPPFISDSARWLLGAGVSLERGLQVQHIYVKPAESGMSATLIINTDRRVYHIILRSYKETHMPMVRWRYPSTAMPGNFIPSPRNASGAGSEADAPIGADPRFLSFNYRITYGWFKKPTWLPELVFDDGSKTYITFPDLVLKRELPAVFENRRDILNYRVVGNVIIIDKLVENITVKIERSEIIIAKKRGPNGK